MKSPWGEPLALQLFLREEGSTERAFGKLQERFKISTRRHSKHPNLVLFKYRQDGSPFHEKIVQEARGIILDEKEGWRVVARAFDKFFNYGEELAADIDWSSARVQEKLDGTLISLYHYEDEWHVATTGVPDGFMNVNGFSTFASYFWETFKAEGGILPKATYATFAFELMGPLNRQVVVHERPSLRLLAAMDRETLGSNRELSLEVSSYIVNIPQVRSFPLQSLEDLQKSFETMSPMTQEGYVVVDRYLRRIKVKHPGYVALHHAKDGLGPRAFIQICQTGETPEVVSTFPELQGPIAEAQRRYAALAEQIETAYEPLRGLENQKEFAGKALLFPFQGVLFKMRRDKASARDVLATLTPDKVLELLDGKKPLAPG